MITTYFQRLSTFIIIVLLGLSPAYAFADTTSSTVALNWSGYVSQGGTYTQVSGSWVIPTVSNISENGADATWVGIGGVLTHDLIQAGTEAVPNGNGGVAYQAWYEMLPAGSVTVPLTVHPGDSMTVNVAEQSSASGTWLINFVDNTTGQTYQTTVRYASSLSSAEWIEEMPAGVGQRISLDDFGSVTFSGGSTTENGQSLSIQNSGAQAMTMQNEAGQELAIPSILTSDGGGFSVTRTDAASSSVAVNRFGNPTFAYSSSSSYGAGGGYSPEVAYSGGYGGRHGGRLGGFSIVPEQDGSFRIILYTFSGI